MVNNKSISGLMCVGKDDIDYLFQYSLISFLEKALFLDRITIVTPEPVLVDNIINEIRKNTAFNIPIYVLPDEYFLLDSELSMHGWSKQQIIKLRSYKLGTDYVLSLGADTILLDNIDVYKLYNPDYEVIQFRKHIEENNHSLFEMERVNNIYALLQIDGRNINNNIFDYIFDFFMFNSSILKRLEEYFVKEYKGYVSIFPQTIFGYDDMKKIGEWSLYSIFLIEVLHKKYKFLDSTDYMIQIHSLNDFSKYDFTGSVVHFVCKDFDKDLIYNKIKDRIRFYKKK